jgi:hypothetical protein
MHWHEACTLMKTATPVGTGYNPIPDFRLPVLLDSPIIAVVSESQDAKSHWYLGCRISQLIQAPATEFIEAETESRRIPINRPPLLVDWPHTGLSYAVRVRVPFWHKELTITVWEYTGPLN